MRKYDFSIVDMTSIDFPLVFIEGNYRMVCLYPGGFRSFCVFGKRGLLWLFVLGNGRYWLLAIEI